MDWLSQSTSWYNSRAAEFAARADALDPVQTRAEFLGAISVPGPILDIGCGSGRDLRAFAQSGRQVEGWEPARVLAGIAGQAGLTVRLRSLSDLPGSGPWAGIWAMGVLLHVPGAEWSHHLDAMVGATVSGGAISVSVKEGNSEGMDSDGRPFCAMSAQALLTLAQEVGGAHWSVSRQSAPDTTGRRPVWLHLIGRRV